MVTAGPQILCSFLALSRHTPVVQQDYAPHNGQANTGSWLAGKLCLVLAQPSELVEDPLVLLGRDTRAYVGDSKEY